MSDERYILECPQCGRVEGYRPDFSGEDDPFGVTSADSLIEEEIVSTPAGPAMRLRCPRCGRWVDPKRARPA